MQSCLNIIVIQRPQRGTSESDAGFVCVNSLVATVVT